uniref:Replication protein A C-terminal domain-containing protein n=1 Tax=Parascaris univalens TaxID=6257 RepID=A0A915CFG8_PARUN
LKMNEWTMSGMGRALNEDDWVDAYYIAGENSPSTNVQVPWSTDNLVFPVTINDLASLPSEQEDIVVGKAHFTTVRVMGLVKELEETDHGQTVKYVIVDLRHRNAFFNVIHYKGIVNGREYRSPPYVMGTCLSINGKIRMFDGLHCVVAFDVRPVDNVSEVDAFHLQAKLARLYYTKNVLELATSVDAAVLENTMLRFDWNSEPVFSPHKAQHGGREGGRAEGSAKWPRTLLHQNSGRAIATQSSHIAVNWETDGAPSVGIIAKNKMRNLTRSLGTGRGTTMRTRANILMPAQDKVSTTGLTGQKAEIFKYLCRSANSTVGEFIEVIRENIPSYLYNELTFNSDINELAADGLIMQTDDDEHFIANR